MVEETALVGAKEICAFLRWSPAKLFRRAKDMKESGVLDYDYFGRPPKKMLFAFPSMLHRYRLLKKENEKS
jgi:hypothetical protein